MALTSQVPDIRHPLRDPEEGLGVVPRMSVLPHFDRFAGRLPDAVLTRLSHPPAGVVAIGIDEDTALVGGPDEWEVVGRQSAWVLGKHERHEYPVGSRLVLPTAAGHQEAAPAGP
jgi:cyanophycinase-like exopeptidase